MISCEKIQEMISSMLDGQLNDDERATVEEHIALCPGCAAMYEDFSALSISLKEEFSAVPATLHDNIMGGVKAKRKKARLIPLRAYLSAAACLVVVVGAVLAVGTGKSSDAAAPAEPAAPAALADPGAPPAAGAAEAPMAPDMDFYVLESNETDYGAPPIPEDAAPAEIPLPAPTLDPNTPAEPAAPAEPAEPAENEAVEPFWERSLSSDAYIPGTKIDSASFEYTASSFTSSFITGYGFADADALTKLLEKADFEFKSEELPEKADAFIEIQCGIEYMSIRLYFLGDQVIVETSEGLYTALGTVTQFLEIFQ